MDKVVVVDEDILQAYGSSVYLEVGEEIKFTTVPFHFYNGRGCTGFHAGGHDCSACPGNSSGRTATGELYFLLLCRGRGIFDNYCGIVLLHPKEGAYCDTAVGPCAPDNKNIHSKRGCRAN